MRRTFVLLLVATLLAPSAVATGSLAPSAPRNLVATAGPGTGQIALSWDPPADLLAPLNYRVYRGTASGGETVLSDAGSVTSFTDSGLPNGATYYYRVTALNLF